MNSQFLFGLMTDSFDKKKNKQTDEPRSEWLNLWKAKFVKQCGEQFIEFEFQTISRINIYNILCPIRYTTMGFLHIVGKVSKLLYIITWTSQLWH